VLRCAARPPPPPPPPERRMARDGGSYTLLEFCNFWGKEKGIALWELSVWRAVGAFQPGKPVDGAFHTALVPSHSSQSAAGTSQPFVTEPADPPPCPDSSGEADVAAGASQPGRQVAGALQPARVPTAVNGPAGVPQPLVTKPGDPPPCPGSSGEAVVFAGASQPGGSGNVAALSADLVGRRSFPLQ